MIELTLSVLLWAQINHDVLACGVRVAKDIHHPGSIYRIITLAGDDEQRACADAVVEAARHA